MTTRYKPQDANSPAYQSAMYLKMVKAWMITNDLWGGTLDIRDKGKLYLPQFNKEPAAKYKQRLGSSVFFNVFQRTVSSLVGMVFKNSIAPTDAPPLVKEMFTDIDLSGNDIEMFLRETFTSAVRDGHSFIFVDAPPMAETGDEQPTLKDVGDRRPYWINYTADQVPNWQYETINGKTILTQITFQTAGYERAGRYGERVVDRYKTLRRGASDGGNGTYENFIVNEKNELVSEGEYPASWREIPVAIVYGRKKQVMESSPPLLELANLNILHYQKTSDFDDICHRICVPILTRILDSKEDLEAINELEKTMVISPAVMMNLFGARAALSYTEVTGAGLDIAATRIKEIELQMSRLGLEMLAPTDTQTVKTATEVNSDNSHSQSDLAVMAKNLETAVEQAFYFTSEMINAIRGAGTVNLGEAEISKLKLRLDYDRLSFSIEQLAFFNSLVDSGKLSLETFLEWLPQVTDMPKNFDPEKEVARVMNERKTVGAFDTNRAKETKMNRVDNALKKEGTINER